MKNITVTTELRDVETLSYEVVERKGIGHPDTMCDRIAERASQYYSLYCLEKFSGIAHHWFDKVMLYGAESKIEFGNGELVKPYKLIFAGKGVLEFKSHCIPIQDILQKASIDALREVTTGFDPNKHLEVDCKIVDHQGCGRLSNRYRPVTSLDLVRTSEKSLVSNDCNLLHAYAPLSRLERLVLEVERMLNGKEFKEANPDTGWDVKVIGSRKIESFSLLVNMPFLAGSVKSVSEYNTRTKACEGAIRDFIVNRFGLNVKLSFNPASTRSKLPYLTVLGSAADTGDVGVVGRGNRSNGLISPMRPMSIEAPSGKNPIDHTGKIYTVAASQLASHIYDAVGEKVEVHIFTSKGAPLDSPDEIVIQLRNKVSQESLNKVQKITDNTFAKIERVTEQLIHDGIAMW